MFGKNPKRAPVKGDGSTLDVQEIFPTIQGEGPYAGWPAVFIRLGGCNLACDFCDTEFESFREMRLQEILENVARGAWSVARTSRSTDHEPRATPLIVITGGEPFRQPIEKLCHALVDKGYLVQIETNGTLYRPLPAEVKIICSPKPTENGYYPLRQDLMQHIDALKFIISTTHKLHKEVADVGQSVYNTPVYVQPMDEYDAAKNAANLAYAAQLAQEKGYRLSVQLHKVIGVK